MGLSKEIWLDKLMDDFWPEGSFLQEAENLDAFVENGTINLAEKGASPGVTINKKVDALLPMATRNDVLLSKPLSVFSSHQTLVPDIERVELAYNKMASVLQDHRRTLLNKCFQLAAFNFSPEQDSKFTPVMGVAESLHLESIVELEKRLSVIDASDDRILVLHPAHLADLKKENMQLFKEYVPGTKSFHLFGFKVYTSTLTPYFNIETGKKIKEKETVADDKKAPCSFAFLKSEVFRAQGDAEMFYRIKDPGYQGDVMSFSLRFAAESYRNKGIAALYTK